MRLSPDEIHRALYVRIDSKMTNGVGSKVQTILQKVRDYRISENRELNLLRVDDGWVNSLVKYF
jgi:hypothetical protein